MLHPRALSPFSVSFTHLECFRKTLLFFLWCCKSRAKKREGVSQEHSVPGRAGVLGGNGQLFWSVTHAVAEENPCASSPGLAAGNCKGLLQAVSQFQDTMFGFAYDEMHVCPEPGGSFPP